MRYDLCNGLTGHLQCFTIGSIKLVPYGREGGLENEAEADTAIRLEFAGYNIFNFVW